MKRVLLILATLAASVSMFAQNENARVLAHRGGRGEFEENVLKTFQDSYAAGMHSFETDIRMTADGKYVISHDSDMERMYGKPGKVEELTLKELKTYRTKGGSPIMTVDELLDFLKDKPDIYIEFEMKTDPTLYPIEKLEKYCDDLYKKIIKHKPADATYLLSSFDYRAIRYLSSNHPGEDFLMLIHGEPINDKTIALANSLGIRRLACTVNGTTRSKVKEAHEKGIVMNLWPGYGVEDFLLALYLGADYICTDYPQAVIKFAKENSSWINVKF